MTQEHAIGDVDRLVEAAGAGREDVARELLAKVDDGAAALLLHRFAAGVQPTAVKLLLRLGADPNALDAGGANALHHAAAADDRESAEALVAAGADLDVRDAEHGSSPVLWAEEFHHREMVGLLLGHGARMNAPEAAKLGLDTIVAGFLDDVPESINTPVGWPTPLTAAVANGHVSTVRLLLERGADPNAPAGNGSTPLDATKWVGDPAVRDEISDLLKRHGATT